MSALLQVEGLRKSFAEFTAVAGVDLSIPEGGITAIIGPNGAGKTTFVNVLTGKLMPDAGRVSFAGSDITTLPTSARVRAGISRTFQVTNIFPRLSVEENVSVPLLASAGTALNPFAQIATMVQVHQAATHLLAEVGLEARGIVPAAQLSHGDRRLLEIAMALATSPRLLMFDEPTAGMGSGERERVLGQIRRLAAGGKLTILLIEHDMELVFGLATRIVVLHQGKVIADGPPQQIREDLRVRDIYLGEPLGAPSERPPTAPESAPLLEVERLNAGYGLAHILRDVSFTVAKGEIVALLGRNGAGKTTTLRSLAGLSPPQLLDSTPSIRFFGRSVAGQPPEALAKLGVSYVPDDRRIFPDLTARENLQVPVLALGRQSKRWTTERINEVFPPLAGLWERKGRNLSGGEQKMLAIARALVADPTLLLLDEPSEGLGPRVVQVLVDALGQVRDSGVTVLLADQNLQFARLVADRALVMERGRLVHRASRQQLVVDDPTLRRFLAV